MQSVRHVYSSCVAYVFHKALWDRNAQKQQFLLQRFQKKPTIAALTSTANFHLLKTTGCTTEPYRPHPEPSSGPGEHEHETQWRQAKCLSLSSSDEGGSPSGEEHHGHLGVREQFPKVLSRCQQLLPSLGRNVPCLFQPLPVFVSLFVSLVTPCLQVSSG